jgi:osmotically-inducible protein OsmY
MNKIASSRLLSAGLAGFSLILLLAGAAGTARAQNIDADVHKALDNKRFQNVTATVHGPDVVLGGTVDLYEDKELADNRVHHVHGVHGVENDIQVAGPTVEDAVLREKLAKALAVDRVGYGTTSFNSLTIGVHNGVVTLGGNVYWAPDKDSAIGLVANTPGVKDIVDNIGVAPLSPMDDQLRLRLFRAIYGAPELQKYALDPEKPIRITVINGNVTLTGMVDSKMDHDIAGIRANTVPGVFKVTNDLQIAPPEAKK